jgi:MoaD family protein
MRVRIRFFALQRQQLGRREATLELPDSATVADAWRVLVERYPVLRDADAFVRFARNGAYVERGERLADTDELAIIPPVAGGATGVRGRAGTSARIRQLALTAEPIGEPEAQALAMAVATPADGAVVTFLGRTRQTPGTPAPGQEAESERFAGESVVKLEYEAYESMALAVLDRIADEIEQRFRVRRLAISHRVGTVAVGEVSVAIAVAAPHREQAFDACRYAIDELKARAPIWKSEHFADGIVWLGEPARSGALPKP